MQQASTNKVFKEIKTKLNEPDIKIGLSQYPNAKPKESKDEVQCKK